MRRLASVVLLLLLASTAGAQYAGGLPGVVQAGRRVRVTSPATGSVIGQLVAVNGDTLRVARDGAKDTVSVPGSRLTTLDVSTGQHRRRWTGAMTGLIGGAILGAVVGAVSYRKQQCAPATYFCDVGGRELDMAAGAVFFGGAGTIVGALVGAGRADSWKRVIPPAVSLRF